jgi:hypothetical protein
MMMEQDSNLTEFHCWLKTELPSNWNGQTPVHISPEIFRIDRTGMPIKKVRQIVLDKRVELVNKMYHFHIIENGRVIFNSTHIQHY